MPEELLLRPGGSVTSSPCIHVVFSNLASKLLIEFMARSVLFLAVTKFCELFYVDVSPHSQQSCRNGARTPHEPQIPQLFALSPLLRHSPSVSMHSHIVTYMCVYFFLDYFRVG